MHTHSEVLGVRASRHELGGRGGGYSSAPNSSGAGVDEEKVYLKQAAHALMILDIEGQGLC